MRPGPARPQALALASYALLSAWFFAPLLFSGQTLFFRDITYLYYPSYAFLETALRQGTWPLWSPATDGGAPFVAPIAAWYPLDLLLTGLFGARGALRFGPPLHLWLAMAGTFRLARALGIARSGAWAAGAFYGASGFVLSLVSLLPLFQAATWAPWAIAMGLRLQEEPTPRRAAALALVAALLVSTLSGEIVAQAALFGLLVLPRWPTRRALLATLGAAFLALALLAPVLLPLAWGVLGTERSRGFSPSAALADAASGVVLLESLLPRFFGNLHAMTARGFWGQPFFASGFPYVLSLYVGPVVFLLALRSRAWRLLAVGLLGVLLALGASGPLAGVVAEWSRLFRAPVKFLFLSNLGLCLAAGAGLASAASLRRRDLLALLPGLALLVFAALTRSEGDAVARLCAQAFQAEPARVLDVVARLWPPAFFVSGVLVLAAGVVWLGAARLRPLVAVLALCDLAIVNTAINPATPASFFDLAGPTRDLLAGLPREAWRLFAISHEDRPLHWAPGLVARNEDVVLYALDRQILAPRTHVLDGLDGAWDEDRTGFAPAGATLNPALRGPDTLAAILPRLRESNVRYLLSLSPLPEELVRLRGHARLPHVAEPLRLYEVPDALPRAFFVASLRTEGKDAVRLDADTGGALNPGGARVVYRAVGPHRVEVELSSGPGWLVVLDGFDSRWRVEGVPGPVLRFNERYRAVATPGGPRTVTFCFVQPHLGLALAAALVALLLVGAASLARIS